MGSLTSRPKVPQAQQPVIVTMPAPAPVPQAAPAQKSSSLPPESSSEERGAVSAAPATDGPGATRLAREDNLLRRGRGRLGTVLTGFSGILSQSAAPLRKTLLGE